MEAQLIPIPSGALVLAPPLPSVAFIFSFGQKKVEPASA